MKPINPKSKRRPRRFTHDRRILVMALMAGLPGVSFALYLLWFTHDNVETFCRWFNLSRETSQYFLWFAHDNGSFLAKTQWTLTVLIVGCWMGFAFALRERVIFPLQTLSNLLAALWEGDYSIRARGASTIDALGEVLREVNVLGETLRAQRMSEMDATNLLRTVNAEIDVAVFVFDGEQRVVSVNRAGERLLAQPAERLKGRNAADLGLSDSLHGEAPRIIDVAFPGGMGRWEVRRSTFRLGGLPHQLLVLSELSRALREEERQAWQRLIRVMGHELNNSLAPIKSITGSLENLLTLEPRPHDWQEDMQRGLTVIGSRAESLSRFMDAYARLARLPQPQLQPLEIAPLIRRVVGLETRLHVTLQPGPEITIQADGDQLEQLLINLLRNAVDATLETGGGVKVGWTKSAAYLELRVEDEGPGLSNTANLFVPFFTTKPGGSGIGLVLSRQIAEAHGGALTLKNRRTGPGCEARLRLPL